jgi:hypothetical protein
VKRPNQYALRRVKDLGWLLWSNDDRHVYLLRRMNHDQWLAYEATAKARDGDVIRDEALKAMDRDQAGDYWTEGERYHTRDEAVAALAEAR